MLIFTQQRLFALVLQSFYSFRPCLISVCLANFCHFEGPVANNLDQISPLKSLQKFLNGELPELDVSQKKEATKRKSEGGSGLTVKKSKTSLTAFSKVKQKSENSFNAILPKSVSRSGN